MPIRRIDGVVQVVCVTPHLPDPEGTTMRTQSRSFYLLTPPDQGLELRVYVCHICGYIELYSVAWLRDLPETALPEAHAANPVPAPAPELSTDAAKALHEEALREKALHEEALREEGYERGVATGLDMASMLLLGKADTVGGHELRHCAKLLDAMAAQRRAAHSTNDDAVRAAGGKP